MAGVGVADLEALVTDICGKETRTDSSAISLTESPIFVEEHPH